MPCIRPCFKRDRSKNVNAERWVVVKKGCCCSNRCYCCQRVFAPYAKLLFLDTNKTDNLSVMRRTVNLFSATSVNRVRNRNTT